MGKFLHFSEAVSLAIHGLEIMARDSAKLHTVRDLAHRLNASEAHLAKVLQRLSKTGFVHSQRGPNGGFVLKKKADEITLFDIFSAIEGEENVECCPLMKDTCPFTECIFSGILFKFQHEFNSFIQNHTLVDFIKKK